MSELFFPDFTNETQRVEPWGERIQIWNRFDASDWMHFLVYYTLIALVIFGMSFLVVEGIRMAREYYNDASPYKLYGKTSRKIIKKME